MTFRFFSIPVTVHTSFWFLSALFAISRIEQPVLVLEWIAVMALAIFIHELGHALAFLRYGHQPAIELHGMGGLTRSLGGTQQLGPGRDAVITFAGPFAGYLLALVVWGATKLVMVPAAPDFWGVLVADLLWASAGWSTLNLCPILPLDGGHLMLAGLRVRFGAKAPVIAHGLSVAVAVVAMLASRWAGWTWTLYMCVWFAARNGQTLIALLEKPKAPGAAAGPAHASPPVSTPRDPLFLKAQKLACETWLRKGELQRAWDAAKDLPDEALGAALLEALGGALFAAKQLTLAELLAARRFLAFADPRGAVDAARAAATDGRANDAFGWLQRAKGAGLIDRALLEENAALASLRADPRWNELVRTLGP